MNRAADLAYWITERYSILLRRIEGMSPPYSSDPIFQTVRFCNVHREDDRVTKWIRKYWNQPDDPAWKFVLGRMINLPESLEKLIGQDHVNMKGILKFRRDVAKEKVFTSAYTISTCGKKMDKLDYVFDVIDDVSHLGWPLDTGGLELMDVHRWLMAVDGLGSFLSAQVLADMKNTKGHPLWHAIDWWSFVAPGPGSIKGLEAYFERRVTPTTFSRDFDECKREVSPLIPDYIPKISNQDFQNCLCEFSKYMRVKLSNGHVRNHYRA